MSLLNLFRKRAADEEGGVTRRLIIDGVSLVSPANGGTIRPPDQLQVLERYGNFSRREKIPLTVLLIGKTLREVDDQGCYGDVRVVYADTREQLPERLRQLLKSENRQTTVVVTGSPELMAVAEDMDVSVMRDKTLRKVVERMQGDRGAGSSRNQRSRGNGGGGGSSAGNAGKNNAPAAKSEKQTNGGKRESEASDSAIDDLIDRV